jgi:protein-tyrosine phosphatase
MSGGSTWSILPTVIDLHCHILPGLDDGARDLEDSVEMARVAESDGIRLICATPHIRADHVVPPAELEGRADALNAELHRQGLDVRVIPAGEVAEQMLEELSDEMLEHVCLGVGSRWLLVEPRPGPLGQDLFDAVERLADRGFRSVIAHPERHPGIDFHDQLAALVEQGALVQATAALVAEGPASDYLLELAGEGLIHLLGSDAHSSYAGREVRLSDGLSRLAEVDLVRRHLDWVSSEGPAAILAGEDVRPPWAAPLI